MEVSTEKTRFLMVSKEPKMCKLRIGRHMIELARGGIPGGRRQPGRPPKIWAKGWISTSTKNQRNVTLSCMH